MNQHVVNCAVPTSVIIIRDVTKDYSKGCYFKYRCKGILYLGGRHTQWICLCLPSCGSRVRIPIAISQILY